MEIIGGEDCVFCKHWRRLHSNKTDLTKVVIILLESISDPGPKEEHYPHLKKLEDGWKMNFGTLFTNNPKSGLNFRDEAKSQGWAVRWSAR